MNKIRAYFGDIMDAAGEKDVKQELVFRNKGYWRMLVLCRRPKIFWSEGLAF